jgi:hypothetical protein
MTSLALFLQQCLTEEKYGSSFISEIDQRLETLNYTQLSRMSEVLNNASTAAKMKTWQEGNDAVLRHVEKWLIIRKKEHELKMKQEEEILRRIQHKEKIKRLNEKEKDRVIIQLQIKARKDAEDEIKTLEIERKASYKERLYSLVDLAENKRNYYLGFGTIFLLIGCVVCGLFLSQSTLLLFPVLGGVIFVTLLIFYRAFRVSQVAPYDDRPHIIEEQIQKREDELFTESMNLIQQHEREYEEKMLLDKRERKKRQQERRHREGILRYLENHPEIPINPEEGDVEAQLQEYLKKNQGGRGEDDDEDKSDQKTSRRIEIIHERSDEEDEEGEGVEVGKEKRGQQHSQLSIAPGKDSALEDDEIPETPQRDSSNRGMGLTVGSSSKYLIHQESDTRPSEGEEGSHERDPSLVTQIQLKLLTLSQFLSSFHETAPAEVYVTMTMRTNQETPSTVQDSPLPLLRTDSQKCVGEILIWRYEIASPGSVIVLSPTVLTGEAKGSIEFSLHSSREILSSASPASLTTPPLASGVLSIHDLLSSPSKGRKEKSKKVSRSVELTRNDVVKVCSLSLEYYLQHPQPQTEGEASTGGR